VIDDVVTVAQVGELGGDIAFALGAATIDTNKNGKNKTKETHARRLFLGLRFRDFADNFGLLN
jgi:hypothetical protein